MDPNIMKFLEEDEDETMHSGADVDAFTAELNRDIEGNTSIAQQPSDSDNAALFQGSSQTTSRFLPQWQGSGHDGIVNLQSGQDLIATEEKEQHSPKLEKQHHESEYDSRKVEDDSSHELNSLPLPQNLSINAHPQPQNSHNSFPASLSIGTQSSREQAMHSKESDSESNPERESQTQNLQTMSSNQPVTMEMNDRSLTTGKGNQQTTGVELSNEQVMPIVGISSQQVMSTAISNQQSMPSDTQQPGAGFKMTKQVPFGMLLPIIQPQLDKDRSMQLQTLYLKLKKNEISKDGFVRLMRSIVGDQMLKMAVFKLQTQAAKGSQTSAATNQFQSQSQAQQLQVSSNGAQMPADLGNLASYSDTAKSREMESQTGSLGVQLSPMSTSSSSALSQERKHPAFPTQGLNKQQHMHFSQTSFPSHGNAVRPASANQSMTANHMGPKTQPTGLMSISRFDRPHLLSDPKKIHAGSPAHMSSSAAALQQNQVQWLSPVSKDQKIGVSSSMTYVKQEQVDQPVEQLHKAQLSSAQGLSSVSSALTRQISAAPRNLKDDLVEMQTSRMGFTSPASMSSSRMPSLTSSVGPGNNFKSPLKKPLIGQKKPMEAPGSSPPSSKKQKVSGGLLDQSIEHLNDVTAVSGVDLREEEEQLFSGPTEDSHVSEASRRVVREEEERIILHKIPLQKKVVEIMAKCGLKSMSNDVERCLSLCVEERMRGLIANLIRFSKQRVDIEKARHRTIVTSDVRQQVTAINRKAREEWEKIQAETEKSQKQDEPEDSTGADGDNDKDEIRSRSAKVNKEEDDKMRATAANVAVRAATGAGDMLSRWLLMAEAKQKQGGSGTDTPSGSQPGKDMARKPLSASTRSTRENQDAEKGDPSAAFSSLAMVKKVGRNQVVVPRVARSISVKDVIATLEREPQMSKSTLIYRLYDKVGGVDAAGE